MRVISRLSPSELLETPESCINHNVSRNAKRDGLKMIQIGQSAANPRLGEGSTTNVSPTCRIKRSEVEGPY